LLTYWRDKIKSENIAKILLHLNVNEINELRRLFKMEQFAQWNAQLIHWRKPGSAPRFFDHTVKVAYECSFKDALEKRIKEERQLIIPASPTSPSVSLQQQ